MSTGYRAFIKKPYDYFTIRVKTDNAGDSNSDQFTLNGAIGLYHVLSRNISTGDKQTFANLNGEQTLTFLGGAGTYELRIRPIKSDPFRRIQFNGGGDRSKLIEIRNWGRIQWSSFEGAFWGCNQLKILTTASPDLSAATSMKDAFRNASLLSSSSINGWDVSTITNFDGTFRDSSFNLNIGNWNVSSATNMNNTFRFATNFNQNINNWDTSNVTTMQNMFRGAADFNQPLNNWDVGNVTNMFAMFNAATTFNQPLNNWDVGNVTNMSAMFTGATNFNQNIDDWNVSNVINMSQMLQSTNSFNQPLNSWNVSSVTDMSNMFRGAENFNQPLNNWDTSSVTEMANMFRDAAAFNQDLSGWCVSLIGAEPSNFSTGSPLSSGNKPVWGTCP